MAQRTPASAAGRALDSLHFHVPACVDWGSRLALPPTPSQRVTLSEERALLNSCPDALASRDPLQVSDTGSAAHSTCFRVGAGAQVFVPSSDQCSLGESPAPHCIQRRVINGQMPVRCHGFSYDLLWACRSVWQRDGTRRDAAGPVSTLA